MNKVIVAPDSFKGTLSAGQAADLIAAEVAARYPNCTVVKLPLADGGEGSAETIIAASGGRIMEAQVLSPDERQITAGFGVTASGQAVLEVAASSGITQQAGLHPMTSSTFGFGQLILHALELDLRDFFLCLGGSATTDAGCGMAAALGATFLDENGTSFIPCGATLQQVARIDMSSLDQRVQGSNFTVMCDVENPLYGPCGAACVYGPQKGANPTQVRALDRGLRHIAEVFLQMFGHDYACVPGAGAAGGLGFGCQAFLNARLESGIDAILELCDFKKHLEGADLIITGEGQLDDQSLSGKALSGILRAAGNVPVISICGICDAPTSLLREHHLIVFETSKGISAKESMEHPEEHLSRTTAKALSPLMVSPF
ncbi:MAG: glycerate kinase [Coriobacteriia bacterium]|nr:glycerate kinase [Coriobacteriia bacterium]